MSARLQESKVTSEICWRNVHDVRQATNASIRHIRKGLLLARKKVVTLREEALANISEKEAGFLARGIQILVDLSGKSATRQPPQGREGTMVEGSTSIGTSGPRNLPPDLENYQGNLPWKLRPRKK